MFARTKHPVRTLTALASAGALTTSAWGVAVAQTETKQTLTLAGAKQVVELAAAEAKRLGAGGAIAVVDDGGHVLLVERLDGTFAAAWSVSVGKARTAAQFKRPTRVFEEAIKNGRTSLVAVSEMVPLQGGVPLVLGGQVVGAIGVSGAASAQQDDDIAQAAADAFTKAPLASGVKK
jgi:glc operon protein GlcG